MSPKHSSPVTEQLFQSCLSELTEGHLALDRLGAPREVQEGDVIRECLIAERISSVAQTQPDNYWQDMYTDLLKRVDAQAPTNPCAAILDHKWLDPNCVENGCQSLVLAARGRSPDLAAHAMALSNGSSERTEKPGALNPAFVCWLMGYPPEWVNCAPSAMPSTRDRPPNSSVPA